MNRKYITMIFAALLFTSVACDEYLDLQPAQSISEDVVLDSDRNVKNVLIGAYSVFKNNFLFGGNVLMYSEIMGGDGELFFSGTYTDLRQIFQKSIASANQDVRVMWTTAYRLINISNNILTAIDVVNEEDRGRVEGEALFLRSLVYFELVRFFGLPYDAAVADNNQLGVPLVLSPTRGITEESYVSRATVQQVYNQIAIDLGRAATILPASNGVFATQGAAAALLARVSLYMGRYAEARDLANAVLGSTRYELRPTYAQVFNNNNPTSEDIFVNYFTTQDRFSAMTEFFSVPEFGGRDGDIDILQEHLDLYPEGDDRKDLFFFANGQWRSGKWNNQYGVVHIIRLAEMYLIRAEANFRLGTTVGATPLADVNTIRARAGAPLLESVDLAAIVLEKHLELAHEGHSLHEAKRLKQNIGTRAYNAPQLVWPIPFREMEANPNLVQNPGY